MAPDLRPMTPTRPESWPSAVEETPWRPTAEQLAAAAGTTLPDVIAPGLRVLFTGINPGLYTAAIQHHFGRPGNRFWKLLWHSGFTDRQLSPFEERRLLDHRIGVTNLVARATATAAEVSRDELVAGAAQLAARVERQQPEWVAVLGMTAFRTAFSLPRARLGEQAGRLGGAPVWLLPNPSGLQAHYQLPELTAAFRALAERAGFP